MRPARSNDDFPTPDGPNTPVKRFLVASSSAVNRSRPKNFGASSGWNIASPTYGLSSAACGSASATARHRRAHSSGSASQALAYALVTARLGNFRPPAASDNAAAE